MTLTRILGVLLKPAARYPADPRAIFILALSVFGGLTALALEAAPQTLEDLLPRWAVLTWGILLTAGSLMALIGMLFQNINGIITEQIGSATVAATTLFYSSVAIYILGPQTLQNVGIIFAWGIACAWRWVQLQILINSAHRRKMKQEAVAKLYSDLEARAAREVRQARSDRQDRRENGWHQ